MTALPKRITLVEWGLIHCTSACCQQAAGHGASVMTYRGELRLSMGSPTENPAPFPIGHRAAAELMGPLTELVALAGSAILKVDRMRMRIDGKTDGWAVTQRALAPPSVIADGLAGLAPDIPALSEERAASVAAGRSMAFFLIDPLDGTKEFVAGRNEFTVNLALVVNGTTLIGIIGAPALGLIWRGLVGRGAERLTTNDGTLVAEPIH